MKIKGRHQNKSAERREETFRNQSVTDNPRERRGTLLRIRNNVMLRK